MSHLPEIQVEIAFDSGWSTPAADRTWTDVTQYVELHDGVSIGVGRGDEFATADANSLTLTLDNTDGRFTPELSTSPYFPNVKVGRPIRVTTTPSGEADATRFVGYVDSWLVSWGGSDRYAKVELSATSRIARLGAARQLRSIIEEEVLLDQPTAYYTLGESEGSTAASDSSGMNLAGSLTQYGSVASGVITFGVATGPGTDDLTAVTFTGTNYLQAELGTTLDTTQQWARCAFNTSTTPVTDTYLLDTCNTNPDHGPALVLTSSGTVRALVGHTSGTLVLESVATFNDGETHDALIFGTSGATVLYVDGVAVDTDATAITLESDIGVMSVGGQAGVEGAAYTGVVAHAAVGDTPITAARAAAQADAVLTGSEGETPAERVTRYAAFGGVRADEIDADTGTPPMAHADTTGQTALDMMRKVEVAEGGVLFDAPDGNLTFHSRGRRYIATPQFTIAATDDQIEADYSPQYDDSTVVNIVTAKLADESAAATAKDAGSVDDYGPRGAELELITTDANEPHAAAWWRVNNYADPVSRVPTLSLSLPTFDNDDQVTILGLTVGSRITVTGLPDQAPAATADYFVEGYTESISPESYVITYNVSPAAPYLTTWLLESATRSQLGTTTRLGY